MRVSSKKRIAAASDLAVEALSALKQADSLEVEQYPELPSPQELLICLKDKDAVVCNLSEKIDAEVLAACPNLKLISNLAVGYDNVDVAAATAAGVLLLNTPGVLDNTTADLAFALLMACARRVVEADRYIRTGSWKSWQADLMLGVDVSGKTVGIVGMGRIGQAFARRARGFDMKVLYTGRKRQPPDIESKLQAQYVDMDELLLQSDFVSLHCPLTPQTRQLIGARELALLKPSCILINTARGAVVNQKALVEALLAKTIAGAGLDVFENEPEVPAELLTMPQVVLTPHIGSASVETRRAMGELAVNGLLAALSGKLPANAVNPEVWSTFAARLS
jgi:glyoxylate reductase